MIFVCSIKQTCDRSQCHGPVIPSTLVSEVGRAQSQIKPNVSVITVITLLRYDIKWGTGYLCSMSVAEQIKKRKHKDSESDKTEVGRL